MYQIHKTKLPLTELGDDRCFEIKYFGHGDILAATWDGPLDMDPSADDGVSTRFGFTHGSDVVILASLAGYLKRCGRSNGEVRDMMQIAGEDILSDGQEGMGYYHSLQKGYLNRVANGDPLTRFDVPEQGLSCLALPMPAQPGLIEDTGGTGIYNKTTQDANYLVFAGHVPTIDSEGRKAIEINRTADFCEYDIPSMARLVCNLALGEYRKDIHAFLANMYETDEF